MSKIDRFIVPKAHLELVTNQESMPNSSTIVVLASDVKALREKLGFFEIIAKEHKALLQQLRYADNDEGDGDFRRAQETIRVINQKLDIDC